MPYYCRGSIGRTQPLSTAGGTPSMAVNEHKPFNQAILEADHLALQALKKLSGYAPSNAALSVAAVSALEAQLREAEENDILTTQALAAARDARAAAEWALHNAMLSVKATVIG